MILVHGSTPPATEDWRDYCRALQIVGREHAGVTLLVVSDDVGPSNAQRDELRRHAPKSIRTSVVTTSAFARSIVTLIGWVDPNIRAFAPVAIDDAFKHLSITASDRPTVLRRVAAMRARLSGVGLLDHVSAEELLDTMSIDPMLAIVSKLPTLRTEIVARRRA